MVIVKSSKISCKFDSADDVEDILQQIFNNENDVKTIQLEGNSFGVEALKAIGNALQICHNLQHLLLNDMFIGRLKNEIPEALKYLLNGVQASKAQILTMNLSDNAIGPVTMPILLPFFQTIQCSSLKYLHMNNCGLGVKGGIMLANVLPCFENLTELILGRNRLEIDGLLEISLSLLKLNKLELLEVPQNGTKEKAIISLCQALKSNLNMRILNLNDNVLKTTANQIADALKVLKHIEVLNLGDCLLGTNGTIAVLSTLNSLYKNQQCSKIKEIYLNGNEIGKDAKDIIITTLETILETQTPSKTKLKVDLSSNNFGKDVVEYLTNHFSAVIDLIIEDDQDTDEEDEENHNDRNAEIIQPPHDGSTKHQSINSPEKQNLQDDTEFNDINSLCQRFFQISIQGFDPAKKTLNEQTLAQLNALIQIGKKKYLKNETDFSFLNILLACCGLIKSEDKSISPHKEMDLSGPILALANVAKEFGYDPNQKRCIKDLLKNKMKEERYKYIQYELSSLIFRF